jgi:RNA-dependent RNA polymerase
LSNQDDATLFVSENSVKYLIVLEANLKYTFSFYHFQSEMHFWTKGLHKWSISVTTEPFLRSILVTKYQSQLWQLQRRARIDVPSAMGRIMMGTVDETGTLKYGQVFVQYSSKLDKPQDMKIIHKGKLMVTKNPCFHPGDMRKFDAIDVPALHHMVDCIVFPSQGQRPHPNEMSGSDLDGDMYFVLWNPSFVIPRNNVNPMDFPPAQKKQNSTISENDLAEFVVTYIRNDQLGLIANAHCCEAELNEEGIFSQKCLDLAKMHSEAVDFPKTGVCPKLPANLRPTKYPRFLMKYDKPSCNSNGILGKLFDQCSAVAKANKAYLRLDQPIAHVFVNSSLLAEGYEHFIENATKWRDYYNANLSAMMDLFGIESEAEILSGYILKVKEQRGILNKERVDVCTFVSAKMKQLRKRMRVEFFEEFGGQSEAVSHQDNLYEAIRKASAWYFVCYDQASQEPNAVQFLSLPWIIADILVMTKSLNEGKLPKYKESSEESEKSDEYTKSGLSIIYRNMSSLLSRYTEHKGYIHEKFGAILDNLLDKWQSIPNLQVLPLAEPGDCLLVNEEILLMCRGPRSTSEVLKAVDVMIHMTETLGMPVRKSNNDGDTVIIIGQAPLQINIRFMYWQRAQYQRALYIAKSKKSNFLLHICLRSLVEWGKFTHTVGQSRNATIGIQELCLLFIAYIEEQNMCKPIPQKELYDIQWKDLCSYPPNASPSNDEQQDIVETFLSFLREYGSKSSAATSLENIKDPSDKGAHLLAYMAKDNAKKMHFSDALLNAYHTTAHFSV